MLLWSLFRKKSVPEEPATPPVRERRPFRIHLAGKRDASRLTFDFEVLATQNEWSDFYIYASRAYLVKQVRPHLTGAPPLAATEKPFNLRHISAAEVIAVNLQRFQEKVDDGEGGQTTPHYLANIKDWVDHQFSSATDGVVYFHVTCIYSNHGSERINLMARRFRSGFWIACDAEALERFCKFWWTYSTGATVSRCLIQEVKDTRKLFDLRTMATEEVYNIVMSKNTNNTNNPSATTKEPAEMHKAQETSDSMYLHVVGLYAAAGVLVARNFWLHIECRRLATLRECCQKYGYNMVLGLRQQVAPPNHPDPVTLYDVRAVDLSSLILKIEQDYGNKMAAEEANEVQTASAGTGPEGLSFESQPRTQDTDPHTVKIQITGPGAEELEEVLRQAAVIKGVTESELLADMLLVGVYDLRRAILKNVAADVASGHYTPTPRP